MGAQCGPTCAPEVSPADVIVDRRGVFKFVPTHHRIGSIWVAFTKKKTMGEGATSAVMAVQRRKDQRVFALKSMTRIAEHNDALFIREVNILRQLQNHPNIVQIHDTYIDLSNFYIVQELCKGGSVMARVQRRETFSESEAAEIMERILSAVEFIHEHNIVHRDLKPDNMVYATKEPNSPVCIIDFGDAQVLLEEDGVFDDFVGTPMFMAPEATRVRYAWELKKMDMWAIGVMAYYLVTGELPFDLHVSQRELFQQICSKKIRFPSKSNLSKACTHFILALLRRNTKNRLSASDARRHKWIVQEARKHREKIPLKALERVQSYEIQTPMQQLMTDVYLKKMDERELEGLKEIYKTIDFNDDGHIDEDEIAMYLGSVGFPEEQARQRARRITSGIDTNHDGQIDIKEFLRAYAAGSIAEDEFINQRFQDLDTNNDGGISLQEFRTNMSALLDDNVSRATSLSVSFSHADANRDGYISKEELSLHLKDLSSQSVRLDSVA